MYGLTLEGKIAYRSLLQLQAGVTMQKAEYKQARAWSDDETVPMEKKCSVLRILMDISLCHTILSYR